MTNPTATKLIRARLASLEGCIREAQQAAGIARQQHEHRAATLAALLGERADLISFLHLHNEATPDEQLKLANVVARVSWPGQPAAAPAGADVCTAQSEASLGMEPPG